MLLIYLTLSGLTGGVALWIRWQDTAAAIRLELDLLHQTFDEPVAHALWHFDETQLSFAMEAIARMPSVRAVELRDANGRLHTATAGQARLGAWVSRLAARPVSLTRPLERRKGTVPIPLGTLRIVSDDRLIVERLLAWAGWALALTALKLLALTTLLIWAFRRRLVRPVADLAEQAAALKPGHRPLGLLHPPMPDDGDLSAVVQAVNHLLLRVDEALEKEAALARGLAAELECLERARKDLVESEKMAALGALVAGVAHEVNTPVGLGLTGASHMHYLTERLRAREVRGRASSADWSVFLGDAAELSQSIIYSLERAKQLVCSFNRVAVDQSRTGFRSFAPLACIQDVLLTHATVLRRAGVSADVEGPPELVVFSDPSAWAQILSNLLVNAVVHGFGHRPVPATIRIALTVAEDGIVLTVTDNGAGMDSEVVRRVFEPFFTTRRGRGSSGLGMHIVYSLVTQRLGGQIEVDSIVGQGTAIRMRLPRIGAEAEVVNPPQADPRLANAVTSGAPSPGASAHARTWEST